MANNKIKVVGYAQKQTFNGDIEYRNFSDNLVGFQQTDGVSTFTFGNFAITTTLDVKPSKIFTTNKFSNFISLSDLNLTEEENLVLLTNNSEVKLKLDKTNLSNYAYFGSLLEYVRVSLESIITKWPASVYVNPNKGIVTNNLTVEDYNFTSLTNESTFKVNVNYIRNPYQLNFLQNGSILDTFNEGNDTRNITVNFLDYSVLINNIEYPVLEFTGATQQTDDYIYLKVKGNPFMDITGNTSTNKYHIKPNKLKEDEFFNNLPDFESNLLNRLTTPKYSSIYEFPKITEAGTILNDTRLLTWPTTDGYNIDFDSTEYTSFVNELIKIATNFDETKTNLMVRFLTAEAISDFDTIPRCDGLEEEETAGQKMNKTLKIYGREYDEIKRRIDGIQYANTVSYNQLNNTPDAILKYLARTMGWELVSSVIENDLLKNYVTTTTSSYSGMSVGYTAIEAEVELWRRIILNTPWLWKSKGARKSIEFLFKFIGAPDGLIEFNEFVYKAKNRIDVDLFKLLLERNGLNTDISLYNIDSDGYPRIPNNTTDMYYQKGGLWYRQTGGSGSTIDILAGNNPHIGPYDGGLAYMNQFTELIPNFSAVTVTSTTVTTGTTNLFTNYNSGALNTYNGDYYVDVISEDGVNLSAFINVTTSKIEDPWPSTSETTDCGCDVLEDDYALKIDLECNPSGGTPNGAIVSCEDRYTSSVETDDGKLVVYYKVIDEFGNDTGIENSTEYMSQECCGIFGGTPIYDEQWTTSVTSQPELVNCGYICCTNSKCGCSVTCDWSLSTINISNMPVISPYTSQFLVFQKPDGTTTSVVPTGCSCIPSYTTPVNITDPNNGETGIGCMLTTLGVNDLTNDVGNLYYPIEVNGITEFTLWDGTGGQPNGFNSWIAAIYTGRSSGIISCDQYMNNEEQDTGVPIGGTGVGNTGVSSKTTDVKIENNR